MAQALHAAWIKVHGFDVRPVSEFGEFSSRMIVDAQDFSSRCHVVLTVVRDQSETDALLFEDQAILRRPHAIETLVICSTLSPRYVRALRDRVPPDVTLIDAPMSGASIAAEERRLSFMLGGETAALDALHPVFAAMGTKFHRMGDFGAGMTAKVLNNFVAASSTVAVRQSLAWAAELGVDRDRLLTLMHDSSGQTWFGSNFDAIEFAQHGYAPENTIGILKKDVESALDAVADRSAFSDAVITALTNLKDDI